MMGPPRRGARPLPTTFVGALALLATLLVSPLALAPRAEAFVYWANEGPPPTISATIGRANLDGSGVDERFISGTNSVGSVAVDAQ
jgi:hypothetical protein